MTPNQTKQLTEFLFKLTGEIQTRHLSPDQVRFRIAHELAQLHLIEQPRRFARRMDGSVVERTNP